MKNTDRQAHWQNVYATKAEKEVRWFQENPAPSLDLIAATGIRSDADIIDVGGGASRLVDSLLEKGFSRVSVLDLSANALDEAKKRLVRRADGIDWIAADVMAGSLRARMTCGATVPPSIFSPRPLIAVHTLFA